uniref:Uncharacterized protein n=1 Tax=viral metagenome TaxID=1070528 RepID=A0A6M3ITV0_9ZZZZ
MQQDDIKQAMKQLLFKERMKGREEGKMMGLLSDDFVNWVIRDRPSIIVVDDNPNNPNSWGVKF